MSKECSIAELKGKSKLAERMTYEARDNFNILQRKCSEAVEEARRPFLDQAGRAADVAAEQFKDSLVQAQELIIRAREQEDAANIALGIAESLYAEGAMLLEWKDTSGRWANKRKWELSGRNGVVEIARRGLAWPDNRRHDIPRVGRAIVRPIAKDGKPSRIAYELGTRHEWKMRWLPEGEQPKTD